MSAAWLEAFAPNPDALFDKLLPHIDDAMLQEIANADYGQDAEAHFVALRMIRDQRMFPVLDWNPAEVLELIRWSQPEDDNWKPGGVGRYGHWLRCFACASLLRAYERVENRDRWNSFNETAIHLADSLRALGGELVPVGIRFLAWCVENLSPLDEEEIEGPFLGLALLSLSFTDPTTTDEQIIGLCSSIDAQVTTLLVDKQWWATRRKNWLLSTNHHNLCNHRWIEVGREFYQWAEAQPPSDKATWLALIGRSLAEE